MTGHRFDAQDVRARALRIKRIRAVKGSWEARGPFWRNHTTASLEIQMLDVLRDIRLALTIIMVLLALLVWQGHGRPITINMDDVAETPSFQTPPPRRRLDI